MRVGHTLKVTHQGAEAMVMSDVYDCLFVIDSYMCVL